MDNQISILVNSDSDSADMPFYIKLTKLPKTCEILVRMTLHHYYCINAPMTLSLKSPWVCEAMYVSDSNGNINLETSIGLSKYGEIKSSMDLYFNCHPEKLIKSQLSNDFSEIPLSKDVLVKIEVFQNKELIGNRLFKRYYQLPNVISKEIRLEHAFARLFYISSNRKLPAIIVLSGSEGRIEKAQNIAQVLANHGFATIAVAYFALEGLPQYLQKIPLEVVKETIDALKKNPHIDSDRIGIYGRSKGAEMALLAGTYFKEIKCLVLNSPSSQVLEGLNRWRNSKTSTWTLQTKEIPYRPFKFRDLIFQKIGWRRERQAYLEHDIAAEYLSGPILQIASKRDEVWDAELSSQNIEKRLKKYRFPFYHEKLIYNSCGHMMTIAYQPNHRYSKRSWKEIMNESNDSWKRTVGFYKERL